MSIEVSGFYWKTQQQSGTKKLLLLALADFADANTGIAYPGIPRLANMCSTGERNIQKCLRQLEEEGEIYTEHNEGMKTIHGHTNRYHLCAYQQHIRGERTDTPKAQGVNARTPQGVNARTPQGVNARTPDPLDHPLDQPSMQDSPVRTDTTAISTALQAVGVSINPYTFEQYEELSKQHGVQAVVQGVKSAADNGKQHSFKYVAACARNAAQGTKPIQAQSQRKRMAVLT